MNNLSNLMHSAKSRAQAVKPALCAMLHALCKSWCSFLLLKSNILNVTNQALTSIKYKIGVLRNNNSSNMRFYPARRSRKKN